MKDQLVFDTTDVDTIADSDHVGSHTLAGDGTLITSGDGTADNVANGFEGLDTRSFIFGYDSVGDNWDRIHQTGGALNVYIDDGDFEVDVVINAEKAEDSAHTTADIGNYVLGVRMDDVDGANSALLAGTEGDYQSFFTNDKGELHVRDNDVVDLLTTIDTVLDSIKVDTGNIDTTITALSHNEDDVHTTGDSGIQALSVRIDDIDSPPAGTLAGTEGDYQSLHTDVKGRLYVNIGDMADESLANTAIANAVNTLAVANTAEDIVASPLADRKYLYVYNNDNRKIYVGATGVSSANGFPVSPGSIIELRAGSAIDIEWVSAKVSHDIRTLELS
jgi:hypothetical protein